LRYAALLIIMLLIPSIAASALPKEGSKAPVMRAVTYDGKAVSTTSLQGKIVVLMFVAEWCPHCREELPALSKAWKEYGLESGDIVGIVMMVSSSESKAIEFFKSVNPPSNWKLVLEGEDTAESFGVPGVPTTVVIDRSWTVAGVFVGAQSPDKVLEPAIKLVGAGSQGNYTSVTFPATPSTTPKSEGGVQTILIVIIALALATVIYLGYRMRGKRKK
jgi:thiol-disulfide isomerase/thioredoxin